MSCWYSFGVTVPASMAVEMRNYAPDVGFAGAEAVVIAPGPDDAVVGVQTL